MMNHLIGRTYAATPHQRGAGTGREDMRGGAAFLAACVAAICVLPDPGNAFSLVPIGGLQCQTSLSLARGASAPSSSSGSMRCRGGGGLLRRCASESARRRMATSMPIVSCIPGPGSLTHGRRPSLIHTVGLAVRVIARALAHRVCTMALAFACLSFAVAGARPAVASEAEGSVFAPRPEITLVADAEMVVAAPDPLEEVVASMSMEGNVFDPRPEATLVADAEFSPDPALHGRAGPNAIKDMSPKEAAKVLGKISLGVLFLLPILSRLVRGAASLVKAMTVPKNCITVTLVQVVLTGEEAARMKAGLHELSFKRDELADRMRWAVRNDVSIKDAKAAPKDGADDVMGESAIAQKAARLLLSAKMRGGWVAGKVDVQSFLYKQTEDAQSEFFAQCAKVRDTMAKVAGTVGLGRSKRGSREVTRLGGKDSSTPQPPPFPADAPDAPRYAAVGAGDRVAAEDPSRQYFIASIVTATIGALGLPPNTGAQDAKNNFFTLKTPETLQEMVKLTDESLLSLEVLWAPEEEGTPLTKEEVMASLEAPRTSGYASVQTLDLYGMNMS